MTTVMGETPHSTMRLAAPRPSRAPPRLSWAALIEPQRERVILWVPVAAMLGAAAFFLGDWPLHGWAAPALAASASLLALCAWAWPFAAREAWPARAARIAAALCVLAAMAAAGFSAGQVQTALAAAPRLAAPSADPVRIEGWVADAAMGASRPRLKILVRSIEGVAAPPRYVQISTTAAGALPPGRSVRCLALLRPPEGPLAPGAYDAAFAAYFARVGATGFSLGPCRAALFGPPADRWEAFKLKVDAVRRAVTETIAAHAPGRGGAVAAALVTGDRSLIDPDTARVFRDSGLGHLLSVSGLHLGLIAGLVFAGAHAAFALIAPLALRFPIRKWAALAALLVTAFYLVLSGSSVPAVRSYVMIAVAMGAILLDRPAISMRGLGVAALIVTLGAPNAVVSPGFQMSFAASAALVAAFEIYTARRRHALLGAPGVLVGGLQTTGRWLAGGLLASVVAGLATDPFALMHFQRVAIYGLPTNLVATPVVSFLVAPAAIVAAFLSPLGLSGPAWEAMARGLDFLIAAAAIFADRPEAVRHLPQPPVTAFALWVSAMLWACLWRGPLRWAGLAPLAFGTALYAAAPKPILLADGGGQAVLARAQIGTGPAHWVAISTRGGSFELGRLGDLAGLAQHRLRDLPPPEACDAALCAWKSPRDRAVFLVRAAAGWERACVSAALVLAQAPPPAGWAARCRPAMLLDPAARVAHGGLIAAETAWGGVAVRRARPGGGSRPWDGAPLSAESAQE